MSQDLEKLFRTALTQFGANLQNYNAEQLLKARLVHDLKISGDDFGELYEILVELRPTEKLVSAKFIPTELSKDSYHVAQCSSWLGGKLRWFTEYHAKRIKCEPLTLQELGKILYE